MQNLNDIHVIPRYRFAVLGMTNFFHMQYSKKVLEHFMRPHNQGKIKNADGVGVVVNPVCGDIMRIYIKIGKNGKQSTRV